jgi:hypothetical protein
MQRSAFFLFFFILFIFLWLNSYAEGLSFVNKQQGPPYPTVCVAIFFYFIYFFIYFFMA